MESEVTAAAAAVLHLGRPQIAVEEEAVGSSTKA